jgi:3-hydroxyanthranilate 3,4-dioxygenase
MPNLNVYNLLQWIEENKDSLRPPVRNKEIYPNNDFIIMAVGGPNARIDYHYNETPEFFYQIKGDIVLKLVRNGKFESVVVREGDIFLLPAKVPHSPQRPADSVGLVIEQKRGAEHTDGFLWFCDQCGNKLHEVYLPLTDIEKQLPLIFSEFNANVALHTCNRCGHTISPK